MGGDVNKHCVFFLHILHKNPGTALTMKQIRNKLNELSLQDYKFDMTIKQLQFCRQKCLTVILPPVQQHVTKVALTQENQMVARLNDLTTRKVLPVKWGQIKAFHSLDSNAALTKFDLSVAKGFKSEGKNTDFHVHCARKRRERGKHLSNVTVGSLGAKQY